MEPETLAVEAVARAVIQDDAASLLEWSSDRLGAGASEELGQSEGLLRVSGRVATAEGPREWSAIAKTLHRVPFAVGHIRPDIDDRHGTHYWRREADAYASGTLDDLGGGLAAARCYRLDESDDAVTVWMEEVHAETDGPWPLERYWTAAEHLGRFNGCFADRVPDAARPWASRGRLVDWVRDSEYGVGLMQRSRRTGIARIWLTDESARRIGWLYERRAALLQMLAPLPETLCHHDAHRRNLLSVREGAQQRTVGVDWAMAGTGRLGEDLAVLAGVSLQFLDVPMSDRAVFEAAVIEGYSVGLRASGWTGSEATLRLGYKAALSLLMGVAAAGIWYETMADPGRAEFAEHIIGAPAQDIAEQWAELQPYLLDLGEEALLASAAA